MIRKPQKAPSESITDEELKHYFDTHPYILGSPKLDGFRCTTNNGAFTSSMKPIKNTYIQTLLSATSYVGLDGELLVGRPDDPDAFANTKGAVSRADGEPDFKLYVYDTFINGSLPYAHRTETLQALCKSLPYATWVNQKKLYSVEEIIAFEDMCVNKGYEGAMVRSPHASYKQGRCTLRELNIFKRKPMEEDEAIIIGFEEQMQNNNPKTVNEMGNSVRSAHKANKTGKGTMGAIWLRSPKWQVDFKVSGGKGIDMHFRQRIWDNQESLLGAMITYNYQRYGSVDAPRIPTYKAFTDPSTITYY